MISYPQNQVFWYLTKNPTEKLTRDLKTDVLIIGGGMAGLSAAQNFIHHGYQVTVLEKNFCGSGASGKSSGFITPDSELGLDSFYKKFGSDAKKLWDLGIYGGDLIRNNIKTFSIACDYQDQDVLVVANSAKAFQDLEYEHTVYQKVGFKSSLYTKEQLDSVIDPEHYFGAIRFPDTFGINCFTYLQAMKKNLQDKGAQIFEDTPALKIEDNTVYTSHAKITASYIIVCVDRFLPELNRLSSEVFQAQTFIIVSEPLNAKQIRQIFPHDLFMVWDTDLIYQYYRIIEQNRLLIGGSDLVAIFWGKEQFNLKRMYNKLKKYIKRKFDLDLDFQYMWPGLIGTTKDIFPIADADEKNPSVYYITGCAGLPWAAALGWYSAERVARNFKEFDPFFSAKRKFPISNGVEKIIGKRITFSLSNFINLYFKN